MCVALAGSALLAACGPSESQAVERRFDEAREGLRQALERLDESTAEGRRDALEALRHEYEGLRVSLDGLAQDVKVQTEEQRRAAVREVTAMCDALERRLDEMEETGAERWAQMRAEALAQAERLRLECERLLGEEP
jgi:CHASE3 domain sensor protein